MLLVVSNIFAVIHVYVSISFISCASIPVFGVRHIYRNIKPTRCHLIYIQVDNVQPCWTSQYISDDTDNTKIALINTINSNNDIYNMMKTLWWNGIIVPYKSVSSKVILSEQ